MTDLPVLETTEEMRAGYRQWLLAPSPYEGHTLAAQKALWLLDDIDRLLAHCRVPLPEDVEAAIASVEDEATHRATSPYWVVDNLVALLRRWPRQSAERSWEGAAHEYEEQARVARAQTAIVRERCAKVADDRVTLEERSAVDNPGGIELHALRCAVVGAAQGIAAAIRALPTEEVTK